MTIQIHPTEADYQHALGAHGVWAIQASKSGGWQKRFLGVSSAVSFGILGILVVEPEWFSTREWVVSSASLIATMAFCPLILLLAILAVVLRSPSSLRPQPNGVIEQRITRRGKGIIKFGWGLGARIVFVLLIIGLSSLVHMNQTARGPNPTPLIFSALSPIASDSADSPPASRVSIGLMFWGSIVLVFVMIIVLAKLKKRRGARNVVLSMPSLLLPRTWEFTEESATERSELLQTSMKWEYLHKFLESQSVVMLYPNEQTFFLIPRAAFTNEMQYAEFMGLLMRKVPNGIMQPRGGQGFAVLPLQALPLANE